MAHDVSNTEDVLDLRDVIERFEELEAERQELVDELKDAEADYPAAVESDDAKAGQEAINTAREALAEWDEENGEFGVLQGLLDELLGYGGNHHPKRPIEELVGSNYGIVRMRLGRVHCMSSTLAAARAARPRGMRGVPVAIRRGWALCVLETLAEYRGGYLAVIYGRA